jgi:hypothetical protein
MSKIGVSLKINVSKIDKARLFKGQKGAYLDATVFIDLDQLDQYGNSGMITQDVKKEEKDQGVKGNILGNCKVFWSDSGQAPQAQQQAPQQSAQNQNGWGTPAPQQQAPVNPNGGQGGAGYTPPQAAPQAIDFHSDLPF